MVLSQEQDDLLEELHRKVKPFIMRRDKMSVLSELPPKVIQDYYCEMTEKQELIYKEFEHMQAHTSGEDENEENNDKKVAKAEEPTKKKGGTLVFNMLNSLRRICNHPYLFLELPASEKIREKLRIKPTDIKTFDHSGKLIALKDLLNEMGFEDENEPSG